MSTTFKPRRDQILYPDGGSKPVFDDMVRFRWIVLIKDDLEARCTTG